MTDLKAVAGKAIGLLDLTNLNDDCTPEDIVSLCARAQTPHGNTAAICIWKEFVAQSKDLLNGSGIRIATVVNFPNGGTDIEAVTGEVEAALASGADEIDLVMPYQSLLDDDAAEAEAMIRAVRHAAGDHLLKVILETGELKSPQAIRSASDLAIEAGADFIKTSTGKVKVNATLDAARIMLQAIADSGREVGFKPAGGIKTTEDAAAYLELAAEILGPDWATPETFRFGASGVLDNLLATLDGGKTQETAGY